MTARKVVAGGAGEVPSPALLRGWLVTRKVMRSEFTPRAHAWLVGRAVRVLTWPEDARALVTEVGVPCDDCLVWVTALDGSHTVRYAIGVGLHWADGVSAHCGGSPAAERAAVVSDDVVPARVARPRKAAAKAAKATPAPRVRGRRG